MPVETQQAILAETFAACRPGGRFIITYGPQPPSPMWCELHCGASREFVLQNVPPATVYVYERLERAGAG